MAEETAIIPKWIYDTLTGDATLTGAAMLNSTTNFFHGINKSTIVTLGCYFGLQAGNYRKVINGNQIWLEAVYRVQIIAHGSSFATIAPIVGRVVTLLDKKKKVTVSGGLIESCLLDSPIEMEVVEQGIAKQVLGNMFRICALKSA